MPGPLSREQYNAVRQRVISSAPDGLSREQFNKMLDDELTKEESQSATQRTEGKPERTLAGFGENLVNSGGRFLSDTAKGLYGLARFAGDVMPSADPSAMLERRKQTMRVLDNAPQIASAAGHALNDRYGGVEQIKNTLYTDPVGVLGDVATVADGVGLVSKASGASKIARIATAVGDATNPVRIVGRAARPVLKELGNAAIRTTVRPAKYLREDFGGSRAIADAIQNERTFTSGQAERKLTRASQDLDQMLVAKDAERPKVAGLLPPAREHVPLGHTPAPGDMPMRVSGAQPIPLRRPPVSDLTGERYAEHVPGDQVDTLYSAFLDETGHPLPKLESPELSGPGVVMRDNPTLGGPGRVKRVNARGVHVDALGDALEGAPSQAASRRARLGLDDAGPAIQQRINRIRDAYPSGDIPLPEANSLKREAQDLAYEAAKSNLSVPRQENMALATALQRGIEEKAPTAGPMNKRTQGLIGATRSLAEAEDRPHALTKLLALGAGGMMGHTNPLHGVLLALLMLGADSPRIGTGLGIGLNEIGKAGASSEAARAALIARLANAGQD